jgi:SAM-dependent methyltransferase
MSGASAFTEIDGFRCYAPDVARECVDYPEEGFELTAAVEADSFWCRSRNRVLRGVIDRFTDRSRRLNMLEIGCGIGGVVAELRRFPHLRLTASEIYLQGLQYARSRFPDVTFIQLDATRMPFHGDFDIVGAFDVIEHIDRDEQVIAGVHEALRPEGLFVVTVPQHPWIWSTLDELARHKRRYTRSDLLEKLRRHRFDVLFCSSFVTALFPAMAAARLLARTRRVDPDRKAALASEVTFSPAVNRTCDWVMRIDESALRAGLSLPFGGSLVAVARKA